MLFETITLFISLIKSGPLREPECYDYSDDLSWSSCESYDWCKPRHHKRNPRRPFYWFNKANDKCSSSFKQIEFLLGTIEPADTSVVNEVFRNLITKSDSVVDEAYVNSKIEFESLKDDLYKNVINCINSCLRETSSEHLEYLNNGLAETQEELSTAVTTVNNQVLGQINQLARLPDPEILEAIKTQNHPFQITLSNSILSITDTHKTIVTSFKNDAKRGEPSSISSRKQKVDECINEAFKSFNNAVGAKSKLLFENLKKKLEAVYKSSETTLLNGLNCVNRRIIEGIRYILNVCREALKGKSCGDTQVAIPLILPDSGSNPLLN